LSAQYNIYSILVQFHSIGVYSFNTHLNGKLSNILLPFVFGRVRYIIKTWNIRPTVFCEETIQG